MSAIASRYNLAIIIQEQRRGQAVRELQQDVVKANQSVKQFGNQAGTAQGKTQQFTDRVENLGRKIGRVLVPALVLAAAGFVKFAKDGIKEFAEFDQKLKETYTLIPKASNSFKEKLSDDVRAVGLEMGLLTDETVPALYQALSAGVPKGNAIEAVALASKAAIAGVSNVEDTMRLGMAVVNAYGGEIYTLNEAYDIMFGLIKYGVPKMKDWAGSLQDVMSIASESRTPFEDVAAALAVMSQQGDSAGEASELLGFLLMQLAIDGTTAAKVFTQAAGQTYREFIADGNGLVDAMVILNAYAQETGDSIVSMVGGDTQFYRDQQAARGAAELTGLHIENLVETYGKLQNQSGSMDEAFAIASDNAQFSLDQMSAGWEGLKIAMGEALWTSDFFFGRSGEQMVEYAKLFMQLISGSWMDFEINNTPIESIDGVMAKIKELQEIRTKANKVGAGDQWDAAYESQIMRLAEMSQSYDHFLLRLTQVDAMKSGMFTQDEIKHMDLYAGRVYANAQRGLEWAAALREKSDAEHRSFLRAEAFAAANENVANSMSHITSAYEVLSSFDPIDNMTIQFDGMEEGLATIGNFIHWIPLQTQTMSSTVASHFETIKEQAGSLFDAKEELIEKGGEWRDIIINNQTEINEAMEELGADLTDEQKDAMWEIVRTAEEGGEEWLSAWQNLQSDLTETQRYETVARLADLMSSHGDIENVFKGDKDAAMDAAENIMESLGLIQDSYDTLALNIAQDNFMERFGEQTVEMQLALLQTQLAMGLIDKPEAEFLKGEIEKASELEGILTTMYATYLSDGELTTTEANNIATAVELIETNSKHLTENGLKALIDNALSETGGFPAVGEVIKEDVISEVENAQTAATEFVSNGPYIPEFDIDKISFDTTYDNMMTQITNSLGPWKVEFQANYSGFQDFPDAQPNAEHASGVHSAIVPGGFPNDSYLIGLTSGEQYSVWRGGNKPGNGGYVDQSYTQVTINNHSKAAAQVAKAQLDAITRKRINNFMGG